MGNFTSIKNLISNYSVSPAEDFFNGQVLSPTKNELGERYTWEDYGTIQPHLVACLAVSWFLICITLIFGVKVYGKFAYFITLSPYFVLTFLLGKHFCSHHYRINEIETPLVYPSGWLEGATDGIDFIFNPDWDKLLDINIWSRAAAQILFSLSVAFGSQLVMSSYNDFRNNAQRDSFIVGLCNSLTSMYAGVVVFLILGFLANQTGSTIDDVVKSGIALAFVSYPSAVLEMEVAPLWSFLFFFMLVNLALSSTVGGVQNLVAFVTDWNPSLNKYRKWIVVGFCVIFFLTGLPMCCNGGIILFTVFDNRCSSSLLLICILELIVVTWFYGVDSFFFNLKEMGMHLPKCLRIFWALLWKLIAPCILLSVTILAWINHERMRYDDYIFPDTVEAIGWIMEVLPLTIAVLYPTIPIYRAKKNGLAGKEFLDFLLKPTNEWYDEQKLRQDEEMRISNEENYYHHNLGYDDDEYMKPASNNA